MGSLIIKLAGIPATKQQVNIIQLLKLSFAMTTSAIGSIAYCNPIGYAISFPCSVGLFAGTFVASLLCYAAMVRELFPMQTKVNELTSVGLCTAAEQGSKRVRRPVQQQRELRMLWQRGKPCPGVHFFPPLW